MMLYWPLRSGNIVTAEARKMTEIGQVKKKFEESPVDLPPEPGKLYTTYQRKAKWNVLILKSVKKGRKHRTVRDSHPEETIVPARREVDTSKDFLEAKRIELIKDEMQVLCIQKDNDGLCQYRRYPSFPDHRPV